MAFYHLVMTAPDLESLRLLVLVGRSGSLNRAAVELGISQPAASKRMSALERKLGVTLVERSTHGSVLTAAGRVVAEWTQRIVDDLDAMLASVEAMRTESDGQLRIAASMTIAEHLAPAWIRSLRAADPMLRVSLNVTNSDQVAELVRSGTVDLGFVETPDVPPGLTARQIASDRLVVVTAPDHPWARRRRPLEAEDLARTPLVVREPGSGTRETVDRLLAGATEADRVAPMLELGSTAAVRSAVLAGAGPAVLSHLAVAQELADRRLVEIPTRGIDLQRRLRAVWRSGLRLGTPAVALMRIAQQGSGPAAGRSGAAASPTARSG